MVTLVVTNQNHYYLDTVDVIKAAQEASKAFNEDEYIKSVTLVEGDILLVGE